MSSNDYVTVKIPTELANEIDNILDTGKRGYKTRAEFVKEAVRIRLDEVKKASNE